MLHGTKSAPHPPTPSPAGEGEQNPYYFLVPLSYGRGARGEGFGKLQRNISI